jgi:hypothetical protein
MLIIKGIESLIGETIGLGYHIEGIVTKPNSYEFLIEGERKIWLPTMHAPRMRKEQRTITLSRVRPVLDGWVFFLDKEHILTISDTALRDKIEFICTLQRVIRMVN